MGREGILTDNHLIIFSIQPLFILQFVRALKIILNIFIKIEDYSIYSPIATSRFNDKKGI